MIVTLRLLVATLALSGAAATHFQSPAAQAQLNGKLSALPIPCCDPHDPTGCHIADGNTH